MNQKNLIYALVGLVIVLAAAGLSVWYAYLTKQSVDSTRTKTFDPLVIPGSGGDLGTFDNDSLTKKTLDERLEGEENGEEDEEKNAAERDPLLGKKPTSTSATEGSTTDGKSTTKGGSTAKAPGGLFKIYEGPVAGYTTYINDKKETIVRLVERQRGNIVDVPIKSLAPERITNSTITGVTKAYFVKGGSHAIIQHIDADDSILTLSTPVEELKEEKETTDTLTAGTYLPVNIANIIALDEALYFVALQEDGTSSIITTNLFGEKTKRVWKSPLQSWNIAWSAVSGGTILAVQKPAQNIPGYAYRITPTKATFEKIASDSPGLEIIENKRGTFALKTTARDGEGGLSSVFLDITAKKERSSKTPLAPSKCSFAPVSTYMVCGSPKTGLSGAYPELWMQGARVFNDVIVKIDPVTSEVTEIIDTVKGVATGLDVTQTQFTVDENFFFFIDRTTGTLWAVQLS
ncbi:MAG: hypothetical protein RI911_109 [Candidatus Parcubacteria bacterium]|jgi:hypothetical protein